MRLINPLKTKNSTAPGVKLPGHRQQSVLKVRMSFDSGTSLLGIYPMEVTMGVWQDLTIRMVITILFTIAKIRNNRKYGD